MRVFTRTPQIPDDIARVWSYVPPVQLPADRLTPYGWTDSNTERRGLLLQAIRADDLTVVVDVHWIDHQWPPEVGADDRPDVVVVSDQYRHRVQRALRRTAAVVVAPVADAPDDIAAARAVVDFMAQQPRAGVAARQARGVVMPGPVDDGGVSWIG